jgi:hypothetical protein
MMPAALHSPGLNKYQNPKTLIIGDLKGDMYSALEALWNKIMNEQVIMKLPPLGTVILNTGVCCIS